MRGVLTFVVFGMASVLGGCVYNFRWSIVFLGFEIVGPSGLGAAACIRWFRPVRECGLELWFSARLRCMGSGLEHRRVPIPGYSTGKKGGWRVRISVIKTSKGELYDPGTGPRQPKF